MTARVEGAAITRPKVIKRPRREPVEQQPAPFSLRCGAALIDYILLIGIVALGTIVARMSRSTGNSAEALGILIAIFAAILDLVLLVGLTGQTVGKWATGLRVERSNGDVLGFGRAAVRHLVGYPLSFLTLGLGFLLAAFGTRGRALHDYIADTIVVRDGVAPV
ncbi:MAG: RDD family protein [Acidobacteriota bacterium]